MFKKYIIISLIIFTSIFLYSDNVFDVYNYTRTVSEPVTWSPEEGVYSNTIYLSLSSQYGKIYYLINNKLGEKEAEEYKNEIVLQGIDGSITDYNILIMVEKKNGNVELYNRTYRIDKTKNLTNLKSDIKEYLKANVNFEKNKVNIKFDFASENYGITFADREFKFPLSIKKNESNSSELELLGDKSRKNVYLVNCTYNKEDKLFTEVKTYQMDLLRPKPPSFGSLYWGQIYRQSYKIQIKPAAPDHKIYYWLREWKSKDLIFGPPDQEKTDRWQEYKNPIELKSQYGKDGVMGIAAYSMNSSGVYSLIAGPYYFKLDEVDTKLEQVFNEEKLEDTIKKKVFVNDKEYINDKLLLNGKAKIKFENFSSDDRFYFTFRSKGSEGKSDLLPCESEFIFSNTDMSPVEFQFFFVNGEKFCEVTVNSSEMILPVMKKYSGNYIDSKNDLMLDFYMPNNNVKYSISEETNKFLIVNSQSKDFTGMLKFEGKSGEEKNYKVKFGTFDRNNNLIKESEELFVKIDKKSPDKEIKSDGINFDLTHNEYQRMKLIQPDKEKNGSLYYRFSKSKEWTLYTEPLSFFPPLYNVYTVAVYVKFVDEAGNELENKEPFIINFDTRAIFVDANKGFSGNGTEKSPSNSLERAVDFAKRKNIKLIYINSDVVNVFNPLKIDSDIIIEPYKENSIPEISMDLKSVWRKTHIWFDVSSNNSFELRNIDFNLKGGRYFAKLDKAKMKLYNLHVTYSGIDDFSMIRNEKSKVGLSSLNFNITGNPIKFNLVDSVNGYNIIKKVQIIGELKDAELLKASESLYFSVDDFKADLNISGNFSFAKLYKTDSVFNWINLKLKGKFLNSLVFDADTSNVFINESDFVQEGTTTFDSKLLNGKNAKFKSTKSLYWIKNSTTYTGFNVENSNIEFERSMINSENIFDYSNNFRLVGSSIRINSSIIRNMNCTKAVNFSLDDSLFEGVNNSIFNMNIDSRSFNFWVTDKAEIKTVNSIYYFSKQDSSSSFIYFNNYNYDAIKPVWFSNIISTNAVLLENLDKKDAESITKDFNEKNLSFTFTNEFNFERSDFFIPNNDSPILFGGLPEFTSPLPIPEKDFLGRNRIIQGFGIDIGAIQKSGNY